jgi:hypothetical protein
MSNWFSILAVLFTICATLGQYSKPISYSQNKMINHCSSFKGVVSFQWANVYKVDGSASASINGNLLLLLLIIACQKHHWGLGCQDLQIIYILCSAVTSPSLSALYWELLCSWFWSTCWKCRGGWSWHICTLKEPVVQILWCVGKCQGRNWLQFWR